MGPWSADLPDVSPPEKQLACQRARLYLNTHSDARRSCMRARRLWSETFASKSRLDTRRRVGRKKRGAFGMPCPWQRRCLWASGLVGWPAGWVLQHHGQIPERLLEPNISISETRPPPLLWLFTAPGIHLHWISFGSFQIDCNSTC